MVGLLINAKHVVLNLNIFGTDLNPLALTLNNPTVPRASLSRFLVDTTVGPEPVSSQVPADGHTPCSGEKWKAFDLTAGEEGR